ISGAGLHHGGKTRIIFHPSEENSGILIKINGINFHMDVSSVISTQRGTDVCFNNSRISTVEHLLAGIKGLGIDNVILEICGNEIPILDGSSKIFCEKLIKNGIISQNKARKEFKIRKSVLISNNGKYIAVLPSDSFKVYYFSDFSDYGIKPDFWGGKITPEFFYKNISGSRTFGFKSEIEILRQKGLIKGATLKNAVLIDNGKPVNTKLRFKNELLRHKILDIIGDMAYVPGYLKICIIAYKTGHTENIMMVKELLKN
ncbi:MAG TPA: UDP-3-O-acyl-N-acetylglucosamine deacetylase, partial [Candidatus Goldiibacteriota bacterium]|nr:UDP-3-O-acyl-N-acetylglucosamine deacetylase [Candidatus Goldiibacteriota bacterium]